LAILSVEAPGWQGAKVQEYQAYFELSQRSQAGWMHRRLKCKVIFVRALRLNNTGGFFK